jgi:hypothetical protein
MPRSYDWQRIRTHRPYTLETFAALFAVHSATVRRWIKVHGLDAAIVSDQRPLILNGKLARDWMRDWTASRKQPCGPDEIFCVACKAPRRAIPGTLHIVSHKPPKITLQGDCHACGRTLRRFDTESNRAALEAQFGLESGPSHRNEPKRQGADPAPNSVPHSPLKCSPLTGENHD